MFDGILGVMIIVVSFILGLVALIYFGVVIIGFFGLCALVIILVTVIDFIDDVSDMIKGWFKCIRKNKDKNNNKLSCLNK